MYIDFEDHRPETPRVEGLSVREGILVSIILHLLLFIAIMLMPDLSSGRATSPLAQQMARRMDQQSPRFVPAQASEAFLIGMHGLSPETARLARRRAAYFTIIPVLLTLALGVAAIAAALR